MDAQYLSIPRQNGYEWRWRPSLVTPSTYQRSDREWLEQGSQPVQNIAGSTRRPSFYPIHMQSELHAVTIVSYLQSWSSGVMTNQSSFVSTLPTTCSNSSTVLNRFGLLVLTNSIFFYEFLCKLLFQTTPFLEESVTWQMTLKYSSFKQLKMVHALE